MFNDRISHSKNPPETQKISDVKMRALSELGSGKEAKVISLKGGQGFRHRVETMGIRVGKRIRVVAKHPWGPIVVDIGGCQVTMGRGMANKVLVEE